MRSAGGELPRVPKERRAATVRRIAGFFRPYRGRVAVVLLTIVVTSLLGLVNPFLLKLLIDDAIPSRTWPSSTSSSALMIIVPIVSGLIGVGQSYLNNVVGQRVMQDLRNALYAHLQRMPLRFFTETRTGEIQSRLANDVGGIQAVVTDTASSVFANLVIVITHGRRDALHRLAADAAVARPAAVLHVPDLPRGQDPAAHRRPDAGEPRRHQRRSPRRRSASAASC